MNEFIIDSRLNSDSEVVCDLGLSRLLLLRNALFPWLILVPRGDNLCEIIDLPEREVGILMREISLVSKVMKDVFKPDKLNIAALGNIVPQLHIHIIARYIGDAAWPNAPFGCKGDEYTDDKCVEIVARIKNSIERYND